jgi:hypothetical protein
MAVVTYRGVKYDTNAPKQEHKEWAENVQKTEHTYRGVAYKPSAA